MFQTEVPEEVYFCFAGKKFDEVNRGDPNFFTSYSILNFMFGAAPAYYIAVYFLYLSEKQVNDVISGFDVSPLQELYYYLIDDDNLSEALIPYFTPRQIGILLDVCEHLGKLSKANHGLFGYSGERRMLRAKKFVMDATS